MPQTPPLFITLVWWEVVRLARRNQVNRNRILFLYLFLLVIGLFAVWWFSPGTLILSLRGAFDAPSTHKLEIGQTHLTFFVQAIALVLLETQLLYAVLFAPAYAALAISEEKDRQTLSLLLTTELNEAEIVWGKTIARLMLILGSAAAGIPVLVVCWLFGGLSLGTIASGYALTVGTAMLSTSIGVSAACRCPDTRTALMRSYVLVTVFVVGIPFLLKLSAFHLIAQQFGVVGSYPLPFDSAGFQPLVGISYAILETTIAVLIVVRGTQLLRKREPTAGAPTPTAYPEPPRGRPTPIVLNSSSSVSRSLPPMNAGSPVLWMERNIAHKKWLPVPETPARWLAMILGLIATSMFVVGAWQLVDRAAQGLDPDAVDKFHQVGLESAARGGWLLAAGVVMAALYLVPLTIGITACVAGERQRQTLDSLLMTLLSRQGLLLSKWQAHVERSLGFGFASVAAVGCDFGVIGGVACGLVVMAAVLVGYWFLTAYGMWLSVRCATPGRAFWLCLLPLLGAIALPLIIWMFTDWTNTAKGFPALLLVTVVLLLLGCTAWWRAVVELNRVE